MNRLIREVILLTALLMVGMALLGMAWMYRYEPLGNLLFLDRWTGTVVSAGEEGHWPMGQK